MVLVIYEGSLPGTVPALETLDHANSSWKMVAGRLMEEHCSQNLCKDDGTKSIMVPIRAAAAVKKRTTIKNTAVITLVSWDTLLDTVRQILPACRGIKRVMMMSKYA